MGAGVVLAAETARPAHFRLIGVVFALTATVMFSSRDLVVRWYSDESVLGSIEAAAAAMAAGMLVMVGYAAVLRRGRLVPALANPALIRFVPAGALFGLSYVLLFDAYAARSPLSPLSSPRSRSGASSSPLSSCPAASSSARASSQVSCSWSPGGALIGAFR